MLGKAVFLYEDLDGRTNTPAEKFLVYWDDASVMKLTFSPSVRVGNLPVNDPDTWLRLQRKGNIFSGFAS